LASWDDSRQFGHSDRQATTSALISNASTTPNSSAKKRIQSVATLNRFKNSEIMIVKGSLDAKI
jgi:hypothetical protein